MSLWSDMLSAEIRAHRRYLQLSGNICRLIEDCQTSRVNNMLTSISHPHANQACQSRLESAIQMWMKEVWYNSPATGYTTWTKKYGNLLQKKQSREFKTQTQTTHAQLIETFCSKKSSRSFSDSLSSKFKNKQQKKKKKDEKSATEQKRAEWSREEHMQRGKQESLKRGNLTKDNRT